MGINTGQCQPGQEPALYVWHETGERYPWPELLRLWAAEAASLQPGDAGSWICDRLLTFAAEAAENKITTPAQHSKYQADTLAAASAYLAQLECDAAWDPGDEPEDQYDPCDPASTGSLLGHPAGEDGFPLQVWLGDQSCDDTYAN
ncbi:MAG TPA: hypothetical protein VKP69_31530 [Isosphaeraceae bacterium]|nr:hypothetical protein [Isosphaeraceae bacterium]